MVLPLGVLPALAGGSLSVPILYYPHLSLSRGDGRIIRMRITKRQYETWLTVREAADTLGRSRQGITWLCEHGNLDAVKSRFGWLINPESVKEYSK